VRQADVGQRLEHIGVAARLAVNHHDGGQLDALLRHLEVPEPVNGFQEQADHVIVRHRDGAWP
jgi:hypothetical protein